MIVLKSLIYIASEREYDVLYTHCSGDLTEEAKIRLGKLHHANIDLSPLAIIEVNEE